MKESEKFAKLIEKHKKILTDKLGVEKLASIDHYELNKEAVKLAQIERRKSRKMLKCKKCGSEDFYVNEGLGWKAFVDDEGVLQCQSASSEIENIFCKKCSAEYNESDFKEVNFN